MTDKPGKRRVNPEKDGLNPKKDGIAAFKATAGVVSRSYKQEKNKVKTRIRVGLCKTQKKQKPKKSKNPKTQKPKNPKTQKKQKRLNAKK